MQEELEKVLLQASDEGARLSRGEISHSQYRKNIDKLLWITASRVHNYQEKQERNRIIHYKLTEYEVDKFKREIQAAVDKCAQSIVDSANSAMFSHNIDDEKEVGALICCEHIWQTFRELMRDETLD